MNSQRVVAVTRWLVTFAALAGIVLVYSRWLHANPTTVALTLVLYVLVIASEWKLRHAIVASIAGALCFNYFFLPPVGTFTVQDPQNWRALLAFLATSVIGSRLSQRARDEAAEARERQAEIGVLFAIGRELLQVEHLLELVNALPGIIARVTGASAMGAAAMDAVVFRQLALTLTLPETDSHGVVHVPLRSGARPRGLMILHGTHLSREGLQAFGGLVSIALDRVEALETAAKSEAAKESERLRTLLLDSVTHELRTPLTSIKGAATALLSNEDMKVDDRRELLSIVDEESDRLNRLVAQAVEMAQLEAHEVQMNFAPVAVSRLVEESLESCSSVRQSHMVKVSLPALPTVSADAVMMTKVLCNLLENAAKYSAAGTPIFLSAVAENDRVQVSVADRGVGIDDAEQALIFDRLYRVRSQAETTSGTGMGLAISRAIAESHGGGITVTSQLGHGSVFTVTLPVSQS